VVLPTEYEELEGKEDLLPENPQIRIFRQVSRHDDLEPLGNGFQNFLLPR